MMGAPLFTQWVNSLNLHSRIGETGDIVVVMLPVMRSSSALRVQDNSAGMVPIIGAAYT